MWSRSHHMKKVKRAGQERCGRDGTYPGRTLLANLSLQLQTTYSTYRISQKHRVLESLWTEKPCALTLSGSTYFVSFGGTYFDVLRTLSNHITSHSDDDS
jgi:hypothetical protein